MEAVANIQTYIGAPTVAQHIADKFERLQEGDQGAIFSQPGGFQPGIFQYGFILNTLFSHYLQHQRKKNTWGLRLR